MNRIGLKVNGIWCVLPDDVSISIEEQNPLFSDSGSFSYPIEMSVSQNRELLKSIDSPQGRIRPQDLDGLPFELWYDGVMLLYGSTETDEDMDIEDDMCSINLVSGNGDFQSKIEGMKCTDVPLLSDVFIGTVINEIEIHMMDMVYKTYLNTDHLMAFNSPNVSFPYSAGHPYCNVRICVKRTDEYNPEQDVPYWVYDADRSWSGVCFYVAYFLDCLFAHLGIVVKENNLPKVEDMMRLAFFTTKCEYRLGEEIDRSDPDFIQKPYSSYSITIEQVSYAEFYEKIRKVYATEKNFPETDVSSVVDSLFNAFGVKMVYDTKTNEMRIFYIRDILRDNEVIDCPMKVHGNSVAYSKVNGVRMTYGGNEDDTSFHYDDWENLVVETEYRKIIRQVKPYNRNCYVNTKTGNKYRIKHNKEAETEGNEKELYPSLFEVAQFNDHLVGKDGDYTEEVKIAFTPVIENDVTLDSLKDNSMLNLTSQRLGVLVAAEMKVYTGERERLPYSFEDSDIIGDDEDKGFIFVKYYDPQNYDAVAHERNPLLTLDSGFTLGIMRGPGNEAAVEVYLENYDGNGNDAWTTVVADYVFTADTMDAYGNRYDYNGTAEGGIADQANSISLKTHIQTAKDVGLKNEDGTDVDWGIDAVAAKRGLADRFMSEYMHFLLNRKVVSMSVDTTLSNLTSLSWFKQLRISGTVGRLKSRKYTLSNKGVTGMSIELYTIN